MTRTPACHRALYLLAACVFGVACPAATDDAAAQQVQVLDDSLLRSMRGGAKESIADRYRLLEPVIAGVFDLPLMARLSVGPPWTTFSADQQQSIIAAFTRLTIAGYAHNFQTYDGEEFTIDDHVTTRGDDKIIRMRISPTHGTPANVIYRARELDGSWKLIDVYYDGISELTLHRSDFTAAIAGGGAAGLVAHLDSLSAGFMTH